MEAEKTGSLIDEINQMKVNTTESLANERKGE